jgi:hypothetical protein
MTQQAKDPVQGEGDYISAKKFQDAETQFAATGPVKEKAREAADALDGPEGEALEAARKATAKGSPGHPVATDKA